MECKCGAYLDGSQRTCPMCGRTVNPEGKDPYITPEPGKPVPVKSRSRAGIQSSAGTPALSHTSTKWPRGKPLFMDSGERGKGRNKQQKQMDQQRQKLIRESQAKAKKKSKNPSAIGAKPQQPAPQQSKRPPTTTEAKPQTPTPSPSTRVSTTEVKPAKPQKPSMPLVDDARIELVAETSMTLIDGQPTEIVPHSAKLRLTARRQGSAKWEMIFESTSFKLTSLSTPTGDAEIMLNGMIYIAKALGLVAVDDQDRRHWYACAFKRREES